MGHDRKGRGLQEHVRWKAEVELLGVEGVGKALARAGCGVFCVALCFGFALPAC